MISRLFLVTFIIFYHSVLACSENGTKGIVEENNLWIDVSQKNINEIDEQKFNAIIDKAARIYSPIIKKKGGRLKVKKHWRDGTVNAFASRSLGSWEIKFYGGLARHHTITKDGFALVVCHEIGHHIGGSPKKTRSAGRAGTQKRWATSEGQADYWATLKCIRRIWEDEDNFSIVKKLKVPLVVKSHCSKQFKKEKEWLVCQRSAMAGLSLASLFHSLRSVKPALDFEKPDQTIVKKHFHSHPAPQCRLDTYFGGALCEIPYDVEVSQNDKIIGTCNRVDQRNLGVRPLCWYRPSQI